MDNFTETARQLSGIVKERLDLFEQKLKLVYDQRFNEVAAHWDTWVAQRDGLKDKIAKLEIRVSELEKQ